MMSKVPWIVVPGLFLAAVPVLPATVNLRIDAGKSERTMSGGLGASFHAIETPIPGSEGGSGWGANPAPDDETGWRSVFHYADWLGLDWCRVELEQRMYEPARGHYDWNGPEMRILYRILDWAEARRVDVFLQQMWGNTAWNAYPELRADPARRVHSAPLSLDDFADGTAELASHLLRVKKYTCIRWLSVNNEPGESFSWWQDANLHPLSITPGLKAARKALDSRHIALPISGPDWTDMPALIPSKIDFDPAIGAYDLHSYWADFDGHGSQAQYSMSTTVARLADWAAWAHARHKPFFLSELGTMAYGWGGNHPGPGSYESSLKNASLVVRGINAGVDAFNRWSFLNRGDLDGQWQLLDTWDAKNGRLLPVFKPHPNAFWMWALLSRYTALRSEVLRIRRQGGEVNGIQRLAAAALRSPKGQFTILVVNEAMEDMTGTIDFINLAHSIELCRYRITAAQRDAAVIDLKADKVFALAPGEASWQDVLPARSVTVYSTYRLAPADNGVQAE